MKRGLDIILSLMGIIVFSPLILALAFLIYLKLGFPIIFKQLRPGIEKRPFNFYKFRSMTNEKDTSGNSLPNEDRLTSFGKFLRRSSLDELPSLFNVIKGDLSLVGPRPLRLKYSDYYTDFQDKRHLVKPGVTGLAQVNGRITISWEEKFALDVEYVENQSLLLDLKILIKTVLVVVMRRDTSSSSQNFEIPFDDYMNRNGKN